MGNDALAGRVSAFIEAVNIALTNAGRIGNSGQFLKAIGDGALLVFSHFPDVAQWHLEFDGALYLTQSHGSPLRARICVHAGEMRFADGDTTSLAVNQLCKLEKKVHAGDLVLTDTAYQLASPSLYPKQFEFEEYGFVRLDGYARPVGLHRLVAKGEMAFLIEKTARGQKLVEASESN